MKKKIISIIGLALFVGAIAFNVDTNSADNDKKSDVSLMKLKAVSDTESEYVRPLAIKNGKYCCENTQYSDCSASVLCSDI